MSVKIIPAYPTVVLDCRHLDPNEFENAGRKYRECLKGHGDICGCDRPQKCGPKCGDYEKAVTGG